MAAFFLCGLDPAAVLQGARVDRHQPLLRLPRWRVRCRVFQVRHTPAGRRALTDSQRRRHAIQRSSSDALAVAYSDLRLGPLQSHSQTNPASKTLVATVDSDELGSPDIRLTSNSVTVKRSGVVFFSVYVLGIVLSP